MYQAFTYIIANPGKPPQRQKLFPPFWRQVSWGSNCDMSPITADGGAGSGTQNGLAPKFLVLSKRCCPRKEKGTFTAFNTAVYNVKNAVPSDGPHPWSSNLRILFLDQPSPKVSVFSSEHHSLRARGGMRADIIFYAELMKWPKKVAQWLKQAHFLE